MTWQVWRRFVVWRRHAGQIRWYRLAFPHDLPFKLPPVLRDMDACAGIRKTPCDAREGAAQVGALRRIPYLPCM